MSHSYFHRLDSAPVSNLPIEPLNYIWKQGRGGQGTEGEKRSRDIFFCVQGEVHEYGARPQSFGVHPFPEVSPATSSSSRPLLPWRAWQLSVCPHLLLQWEIRGPSSNSRHCGKKSWASILFDKRKNYPTTTWCWYLEVLSFRKFQVPLLSEHTNCLWGKVVLIYRGSVFFLSLLKKPVIQWAVKWKIKIRGSGNNIMYLDRNTRTPP